MKINWQKCCEIIDDATSLLAVVVLFGTVYGVLTYQAELLTLANWGGGLGLGVVILGAALVAGSVLGLIRITTSHEGQHCFCTFSGRYSTHG